MTNTNPLAAIYLFSDFSSTELEKIYSIAEEKNFVQGQEVFSRGDNATAFYVVQMGTVKLLVNSQQGDEIQFKILGTGSHFGEMPFIDGEKRSATVQTVETSRLLEISYKNLMGLLDTNPPMAIKFYRSVARLLALRLRATTTDLNQLKELRFQH